MRVFEDNYKPIEFMVKNIEDKEFLFTSIFQSSESTRQLESILKNMDSLKTDQVLKTMVLWFGKNEKFYQQFSLELLTKIMQALPEEQKKNVEKTTGSIDTLNLEG
jgi:hypothetical protein